MVITIKKDFRKFMYVVKEDMQSVGLTEEDAGIEQDGGWWSAKGSGRNNEKKKTSKKKPKHLVKGHQKASENYFYLLFCIFRNIVM